jgi:hypothetical protein
MVGKITAIVLVVAQAAAWGQTAPPPGDTRLVVMIVIDQFRGDYPGAYRRHFVEGGFNRLMRDGAWMTQAHLQYGCTATGPGHATLGTGANPSQHGVVGNDWILPKSGGNVEYCCGGGDFKLIGLEPHMADSSRSPQTLQVATLGERMKVRFGPKCQVWGTALKDRAAILTAGRNADGAIWWHPATGNFISSNYYGAELPTWVQEFNKERFVDRYFGKEWDRLLDASAYPTRFLSGDDAIWKKHHPSEFPKTLGVGQSKPNVAYYGALYCSPFGNDLVFELAKRAINAQSLGADDYPDLLTVCLSSNDVVGHKYGPGSDEVMDCSIRTDRQLAEFLDWLDREVGLNRCIVALSSDHGVGPIAEFSKECGHGGGRHDSGKIEKSLEAMLVNKFGEPSDGRKYVRDMMFPWLYLDEDTIAAQSVSLAEVARLARDEVGKIEGVAKAFDLAEIESTGFAAEGVLQRQIVNSYFPGRCGHVYVHWDRYWAKGRKVAVHGAALDYDQHVPVMLMARGIKPGKYDDAVCATGMVATISHLLGMADRNDLAGRKYDMILSKP